MLISTLSQRSVSFNIIFLATFGANQIARIVQCLGKGGSIAAGTFAVVSLLIGLWSIMEKYEKSFRDDVEPLKVKLDELQTEYGVAKRKFQNRVTNRMKAKN